MSISPFPGPPTGTVTFLFTDIEGSTKRWEHRPQEMSPALARHDDILRQAIEANGGYIFKTMGDAFCAAFPIAPLSLQAALDAQRAVLMERWSVEIGDLRVRMALHTGAVEARGGDYFGQPLNRVARILSTGHGGQILLSQAAYELVRDALPLGASIRDIGEYRLKDLYRPEHIYQLLAPDLPSEFPALNTLDAHPNNLPVQRSALIGREDEVAAIQKLLLRHDTGLLTLTGPGGTGKTRLALQAGADLLEDFADGVYFIELAALVDQRLVLSTLASTLGIKEVGGTLILESIESYLKGKHILLILDNFEQVVEAGNQVGQLLARSPHLKVLVTSRTPLRIRGEKEYAVPLLRVPDLGHLPPSNRLMQHVTQYEAVRLFIERATDVKADFVVNNDNAPAVAEICARLDGLPLAIELAAAWVRMLPPHALLARLSNRLKVLTGGARDMPARQQTLRNTLEWSYSLLDEGEKQLFRRMAVFQGGRTLEAIEGVCNFDGSLTADVLVGVGSLVSKSLLQQREGSDGEPRFWMLETIHEYAREKLAESGEAEKLSSQHARFFVDLAEEARPKLRRSEQVVWLAELEEEHDNLRAALRWLLAQEDGGLALQVAGALHLFWYSRGHLTEGREWLKAALSHPGSQARTRERARALYGAARLAYFQGDYMSAEPLAEESIATGRELGDATADEDGLTHFLTLLGAVAMGRADYALAKSLYEEVLPLSRQLGDDDGIAYALLGLGELMRLFGDYEAAKDYYVESLALYRRLQDRVQIMPALLNIAIVACHEGDYPRAIGFVREALAMSLEMGETLTTALCFWVCAGVEAGFGRPERAARLLAAAEAQQSILGSSLEAVDRVEYDLYLSTTRAQLDDAAWDKAWTEGQSMSIEEAIAYALEEIGPGQ